MARIIEVGVQFTATDGASPVLLQLSDKANKTTSTFGKLGFSFISLNQGINLLKKAFRLLDNTFGDTVRKALEYRFSNDEAKKSLTGFAQQVTVTQARLGDLMIPALHSMAEAAKPLVEEFDRWLAANEKMLAQDFGGFLIDMASALKDGVLVAADLATDALAGFRTMWHSVTNVGEVAALQKQTAEFIKLAQAAADAGDPALAQNYLNQAKGLAAQSQAIQDFGAQEAALAAQRKAKLDELDAKLDVVLTNARNRLANYHAFVHRSSTKSAEDVEKDEAKKAEALKKWQERRLELMKAGDDAIARFREDQGRFQEELGKQQTEEGKKSADQIKNAWEKSQDAIKERSQETAHTLIDAFKAIAGGGEDMAKRLLGILEGVLEKFAEAQLTEALFQVSGGGGSAPAPDVIRAGTTPGDVIQAADRGSGLLSSLLPEGDFPAFARGGEVRGPSGTDRVPIWATSGEYVLSKWDVAAIRNAPRFASGGSVGGGLIGGLLAKIGIGAGAGTIPLLAGGAFGINLIKQIAEFFATPTLKEQEQNLKRKLGPDTSQITISTFAVPSRAQYTRWYRDSADPVRRDLERLGKFNRGG